MAKLSKEQKNYMLAKAKHETVIEIAEQCGVKVLKEHPFYISPKWEEEAGKRIIKPFNTYLMTDEDFQKYLDIQYEEYKKAGLNPRDRETTADYLTSKALSKAEKELIEWGFKQIENAPLYKKAIGDINKLKEVIAYDMKIRDKVINLTMRLAV